MKWLYYHYGNRVPKNKLESELFEFLRKNNRRIFTTESLQAFRAYLDGKLNDINLKYKRCAPGQIKFKQTEYGGDWSIFVGSGDTSAVNVLFLVIKEDDL